MFGIFVDCFCAKKKLGKIVNLLLNTFHSTKYFHAPFCHATCYFCVGQNTYSKGMQILW
jgi:coproporphyrinogen III oxidase-like Fe-S oxidoreductase